MKSFSILAAAVALAGLVAAVPTHKTYYESNGNYYNNSELDVEVDIQIDVNTVFYRNGNYYNYRNQEIDQVDIQIDATIIIEESDDDNNDRHHGHGHSKRGGHPTYYYYDGKYHNSDNEVVEVQIDIEIAVFFRNGKYYNSRGREIEEVDIQVDATIIIDSEPSHHGHGHSKRDSHPTYYYYDGEYHNSDSEVVDVQIDIDIAVFFRDGKYYNSRNQEIEEVDIQVDAQIIIDSKPSHHGHGHSKRDSHPTYYYYDGEYHNSDSEVVDVQINIDIAVFFRDGKYYNSRGSEIAEVDIQVDAQIIIDSKPSHHGHGHSN